MTAFQKKAFWIVVLLQLGVLSFMIGKRVYLLRTGKTVLLECRPVDPRSLFSGDYVILNYEISQLANPAANIRRNRRGATTRPVTPPPSRNIFGETFRRNDTVYVALQKKAGSKFWGAVAISHHRRKLKQKFPVVIRGTLLSKWGLRVRYGVEQYFVPQFAGKRIERRLAQASVEVAISSSGESAVKRLFIAGREVKFR